MEARDGATNERLFPEVAVRRDYHLFIGQQLTWEGLRSGATNLAKLSRQRLDRAGATWMRFAPGLLPALALALPLLAACGRHEVPQLAKGGPVQVSVVTVEPRDVPAVFEYVTQRKLAQRNRGTGAEVHRVVVLNQPAAGVELPIDFSACWLFRCHRWRGTLDG